ncbi:SURF1 family protein [Celeribacter neptunius]|uniref:SURF1-like protein n=1 Tax=Celeribacter neptunius TaxID=588602 RepID=A0A1I3R4A7_9RHOB|nr:SURF1 family protein [Celeribacter neptunius]SFJ40271.1 surfeit locus 1 family protein [Celeribacter neptunius]
MRLSPRLFSLKMIIATLLAALGIAGFMSLGFWQVNRLHWKLDLIDRVDARIHADPVAAPGPADWAGITAEKDEYTRVTLKGAFLADQDILIYTPSDFGPGDWVLTPFQRDDGTIVMVNRGVVPDNLARAGAYTHVTGPTEITGLLRRSEDQGWLFSRDNDPENGKWYRRDIGSITAAKGFANAAPYFVDQELTDPTGWPRGGKTVVSFRNAHLSYALTWFALAGVVLLGYALVLRLEFKRDT